VETWKDNSSASHGQKYSPKDIFNVDAYALFCTLLPYKTYTFKGASC